MNVELKKLKNLLKSSETLTFDGDIDLKNPPIEAKSQAAVLLLIHQKSEPMIILTQRSSKLRHHSGQVSFPGGRKDPTDASLFDTAKREAHEEIGLPLNHPLTKWGQLPKHITITGFEVTPFVVSTNEPFEFIRQEEEVESIFEIPLSLLKAENFSIHSHETVKGVRHYYVLDYPDYFIWGATARMLKSLSVLLEAA